MLEFNNEHKSLDGSLKKKVGLRIKDTVICGILTTCVLLFTGCSKVVPCDIEQAHAHYYVNENGFDRYIISEKDHKGALVRTNEYIFTNKDIADLINFENKKDLFRIAYNKDKIDAITSSQVDYLEYRYEYTWLKPQPLVTGETVTTIVVPTTSYSWTTNPDKEGLTGKQRAVHYVYYGYKIIKDKKGNLKAIRSEMVDDLNDLPEDYNYIKSKFYKKVHLNNKDLEIEYEDDPTNDPAYNPQDDPNVNKDHQKDYERQVGK